MKSKSIIIIHYAPLEFYPPIQNLLHDLEKNNSIPKVLVFTTHSASEILNPFTSNTPTIKVIRLGRSDARDFPIIRYWNYLIFYSISLLLLMVYRPDKVLYYETISSWPVYLYKRFFRTDSEVLIHYHEYTTPEEYRRGMKLTRYFHQLEMWLYSRSIWISHTNEFRMSLFKNDVLPIDCKNSYILPNYPSRDWALSRKKDLNQPLKVVYVGSFSVTTMYTKEFATWVSMQNGTIVWDIFSYNFTQDAKDYIHNLKSKWVNMKDGVNYDHLPEILRQYDVGVILYNGHIPNYIYNAPNKLFEYLACGLDVWFPKIMTGSMEYVREQGFPKVLALDFSDLSSFNPSTALNKIGGSNTYSFFCEEALRPLLYKLITR